MKPSVKQSNKPMVGQPPYITQYKAANELAAHAMATVDPTLKRGEALAKIVEARHQYHSLRKIENMQDELERLASTPDGMQKFRGRASQLRRELLQTEMRDPRSSRDMDKVIARLRRQHVPREVD